MNLKCLCRPHGVMVFGLFYQWKQILMQEKMYCMKHFVQCVVTREYFFHCRMSAIVKRCNRLRKNIKYERATFAITMEIAWRNVKCGKIRNNLRNLSGKGWRESVQKKATGELKPMTEWFRMWFERGNEPKMIE